MMSSILENSIQNIKNKLDKYLIAARDSGWKVRRLDQGKLDNSANKSEMTIYSEIGHLISLADRTKQEITGEVHKVLNGLSIYFTDDDPSDEEKKPAFNFLDWKHFKSESEE